MTESGDSPQTGIGWPAHSAENSWPGLAPVISPSKMLPWEALAELSLRTIPDSHVFLIEDRTGCFPCAGSTKKQAKLNNTHTRFNLISPVGRGELKGDI